jgi:ABC-type multidrug transport system fused ATPase/permease subunit
MSLEGLRKEIGYVPQEPVLFNDSIRNNVLMGRSVDNADEKI